MENTTEFAKSHYKIIQIFAKNIAESSYILQSQNEAIIVDPTRDITQYIDYLQSQELKLRYVLETHFHADFVSGHLDIQRKTGAQIVFGPGAVAQYPIRNVRHNDVLPVGEIAIKVLHTPGHTPESVCYVVINKDGIEECVFTGDTLFVDDVGRPDLLESAHITREDQAEKLYHSIHDILSLLPNDCLVLPGHGPGSPCGKNLGQEKTTTIGKEKSTNYAFKIKDKKDFCAAVLLGIVPPPQYFLSNVHLNKNGYEPADEIIHHSMRSLTLEEFENNMKNGMLVMDTRPVAAFAQGHIPGSIFIGIDGMFPIFVGSLIKSNQEKIILVCQEDRIKDSVVGLLRVGYHCCEGYLNGGFEAWKDSGKQVATITTIEPDAFAKIYKGEEKNYQILDVRKDHEYLKEHLDNAISCPLAELRDKIEKTNLKKEEPFYVHCAGGYRSMVGCSILQQLGYKIININNGITKVLEHVKHLQNKYLLFFKTKINKIIC